MRRRSIGAVAMAAIAVVGCTHATGSHTVTSRESRPRAPSVPATSPGSRVVAAPAWEQIASSVQGRPLRLARLGAGPRKVLWVGGIHGDEPEGAAATLALPADFEASGLAGSVTLLVLEDANPDGRAAHTRTNARGVDLNRNFPSHNFDASDPRFGGTPLSQPESKALHDLIVTEHPELVVACHSWRGGAFVNFDGPAAALARAFSTRSGLAVRPSAGLGESTPGSLGTWLGQDKGVAVLTIEWRRGSNSKQDWRQSRDAVFAAIHG